MPTTNEQALYASMARFAKANKNAAPTSTPIQRRDIKIMDEISELLGVPVKPGTPLPLYVINDQVLDRWHAMCDPSNVKPNTSRIAFVPAMESMKDHILNDLNNARNAELTSLRQSAAPEARLLEVESLLDNAGVSTVSEAVRCSEIIEGIAAGALNDKAIKLLEDSRNATPRDRLFAVAAVRLAQPPDENGELMPMDDFVRGLEQLENEGRVDLLRNVLDSETDPNTNQAWTLQDAVDTPPPPAESDDEDDQDEEAA